MEKICKDCGAVGDPKQVTKGSFFIEIVLWCFFLVPGLIYSIWRLSSRHEACKTCDSKAIVPLSSPLGKNWRLSAATWRRRPTKVPRRRKISAVELASFSPRRNKGSEMKKIEQVLVDPASSYWLKEALQGALKRDPVDAVNDAMLLAELLEARLDNLLKTHGAEMPNTDVIQGGGAVTPKHDTVLTGPGGSKVHAKF